MTTQSNSTEPRWFSVDTTIMHKICFKVQATSAEHARQLVGTQCGMQGMEIITTLPFDSVQWSFSSQPSVTTGDVVEIKE